MTTIRVNPGTDFALDMSMFDAFAFVQNEDGVLLSDTEARFINFGTDREAALLGRFVQENGPALTGGVVTGFRLNEGQSVLPDSVFLVQIRGASPLSAPEFLALANSPGLEDDRSYLLGQLGGDDRVIGGDLADRLQAGRGNDLLSGNDGNDTIFGQGGDDRLFGGGGTDRLIGGAGNDRLVSGGGSRREFLDGGAGDDVLIVSTGSEARLLGGEGNDRLIGASERDVMEGGAGNDTLIGKDGGDRLFGGAGDDLLFGGDGIFSDVIEGGAGNDRLIGGTGNDRLTGGEGADFLRGDAGNDRFIFETLGEMDVIADFQSGRDLIDLSATGLVSFDGRSFSGQAGSVRRDAGILEADVDGDGLADFQIARVTAVTEESFIF